MVKTQNFPTNKNTKNFKRQTQNGKTVKTQKYINGQNASV